MSPEYSCFPQGLTVLKSPALSAYEGMHATVMGLGRFAGGVAAARFLAQHGAVVTVTDVRSADDLADSLAMLSELPVVRFALGGHPEDVLADCQLLVVNPAVRPDHPLVALAKSRQIDVTTEIELSLNLATGRLLEFNNIYLQEGKWCPEAYDDALLRAQERTHASDNPNLETHPREFASGSPVGHVELQTPEFDVPARPEAADPVE